MTRLAVFSVSLPSSAVLLPVTSATVHRCGSFFIAAVSANANVGIPAPVSDHTVAVFHCNMHHIWSNNTETSIITAFRSLTNLLLPGWGWTDNAEAADLWCLDLENEPQTAQITARYRACSEPRPKVIFLSHEFAAAPVPDWVYFRSPVNSSVLTAWLWANGFSADASQAPSETGDSRWKANSFRLKRWPNTTDYSDDPAIVLACGAMLRNWHTQETVLQLGIDADMLSRLLDDAEKADNMEYRQEQQSDNTSDTPTPAPADKSKSPGMWGKLKGLIGIS